MESRRQWDSLGEADPLWAVVSVAEMRGGRWDVDAFFQTGVERVDHVLGRAKKVREISHTDRALDYGCGVGRLTQRLADYFTEVVGVDIAPSMIREAQRLNRKSTKCRYLVTEGTDLSSFSAGEFDLVYSDIVLQHIRPADTVRLIPEFLRVTRPGGLVLFQLPAGPVSRWLRWMPSALLDPIFNSARTFLRKVTRPADPTWESHWVPVNRVRRAVEAGGGTLLALLDEPPIHGKLENHLYVATPSREGVAA